MNTTILSSDDCPYCHHQVCSDQEKSEVARFSSFGDFGTAVIASLHAVARDQVTSRFNLSSETQALVVHRVLDIIRSHKKNYTVSNKVVDNALINVLRHDIIVSNKIKNSLARELGSNRLDAVLSDSEQKEFQNHLNSALWVIVRKLRKYVH